MVEPTPQRSATQLVVMPSYNTGPRLIATVREARRYWDPVWIVIDGSDADDVERVERLARDDAGLRILSLPRNRGKGASIFHALSLAAAEGFTHALTFDADGQHPAARIPDFMAVARRHPEALVLGRPVFDDDAPRLRVHGRRVSNFLANLETLWLGVEDSLFGFRVYPIGPLCAIMQRTRSMRRFDFDAEAAVRLCWRGMAPISVDAPVRYLAKAEGGVSQFRYLRDNLLLTWMHLRLSAGFILQASRLVPDLRARRSSRLALQATSAGAVAGDHRPVDIMQRAISQVRFQTAVEH